jgi:hypothetical protein
MKQLRQRPSYSGAHVTSPGSSGVVAAVFVEAILPPVIWRPLSLSRLLSQRSISRLSLRPALVAQSS